MGPTSCGGYGVCLALMLPGVCSATAAEQVFEVCSSLRLVSRSPSPQAPGYYSAVYLQRAGYRLRAGANVSTNNGRTWKTKLTQPAFVSSLRHGCRRNPVTLALDPFTGRLINDDLAWLYPMTS